MELTDILQSITRFILDRSSLIMLLTSIVSALIALVFLLQPRFSELFSERWATYFGLSFAASAIQYAVVFSFNTFFAHPDWVYLTNIVIVSCQIINNLLLLGAARLLLNRHPALPTWALLIGLISTSISLLSLDGSYLLIERLPKELFSSYCYALIGYALFTNISFRYSRALSVLAISVSTVTALINLVYALNPLLAQYELTNFLIFSSGNPFKLAYLDSFTFALFLPLKVGLFLPAYFVLMLLSISTRDTQRLLNEITTGKKEFLSSDGIIRAIGEGLQADTVNLSILLPSTQNPRVISHVWKRAAPTNNSPAIRSLRHEDNRILSYILETGLEYYISQQSNVSSPPYNLVKDQQSDLAVAAVPIFFHGAVIGCLQVEMKGHHLASSTAVKTINKMAAMISPFAQSQRELEALDQLSYRFTKLQVDATPLSWNEVARQLVNILHDILSPLGTGMLVDVGFQSNRATVSEDDDFRGIIDEQNSDYRYESSSTIELRQDALQVEVMKSSLVITGEQVYPIGQLILIFSSGRDSLVQPFLATNFLHRRVVVSLVADSLLNFARDHFSSLSKNLGVRINVSSSNFQSWFNEIERTAREAGLLWMVSTEPFSDDLFGDAASVEIVECLHSQAIDNELECLILKSPISRTHHVIKLHLRLSKVNIWFGVGRPGFGLELNFASPWRVFLEHIAETADAALVRLIAAIKFQQLQIESAQYQGLATVAVTIGTLAHQLINMTREISMPVEVLLDALNTGQLKAEGRLPELILSMRESSSRLLELTSALTNVTKTDDRRPCLLLDAANQAKNLFASSLTQREIKLDINVAPDLVIDVPFHVAALALANLVANAKDALWRGGVIDIGAEENERFVLCHIKDNGPGVPAEIKDRLFNLGVTTKPNGTGWGLYLVDRSLRENGCRIQLDEHFTGGAQFTIHFPKPKQENSDGE